MSFGLVEVITLLLGLSGFGLQANPKASTPDQALHYAMADADLVVHADVTSVVSGNYKLLLQLPQQPAIKSSPELSKEVRKVIGEVEGFKGIAKTMTGVDVTTDINDATLFLKFPATTNSEPTLVIAVRGKFDQQTIVKIAKLTKPATRVGGGSMIELAAPTAGRQDSGPGIGAIAVTKDGTFLAGTTQLVRERLADTWRAPTRTASSNLAHAADAITARPVLGVVVTMSATARKQALGKIGKKNFLTDLIQRHKLLAFSVYRDGLGWTWGDSTRVGLDAMTQMSEGMMDLLKAAQIAPRGFTKLLLGGLESYRGTDKKIDELLKRRADVWKIVESYTGDGSFKVQIDRNPATLRLTARATGKTLSEVVPAGFVVPIAMIGLFLRTPTSQPPAMQPRMTPAQPSPSRPAPAPQPTKRAS